MKQLIFNFNMFDVGQKALIVDTETGMATASYAINNIDDAGVVIAKTCIDTEIFNVHLFGEENYLTDFVIPDIQRHLNLSNYNCEKVKIEVN